MKGKEGTESQEIWKNVVSEYIKTQLGMWSTSTCHDWKQWAQNCKVGMRDQRSEKWSVMKATNSRN